MLKLVSHRKLIVVQTLGLDSYKMIKNDKFPFLPVKAGIWGSNSTATF